MTKKENKETLINWLKSAYNMEKTMVGVLDKQAEHASAHPELQAQFEKHKNETQRHVDLVKSCVERHGAKVSEIRAGMSKLLGIAQGSSMAAFDNVVIKETVLSSASEEMEISTYKAIIALATLLEDDETASICEKILAEEEAMLKFLNEQVGPLVEHTYIPEARV